MPTFSLWDIVKVPFPYTDRPVRERRPALVIASEGLAERHGLVWVLMITSYANRGWEGDVPVSDLKLAGLSSASVVRSAKIATIEEKEAVRIGELGAADRAAISLRLSTTLAPALA
jgi:PemK-like protein.